MGTPGEHRAHTKDASLRRGYRVHHLAMRGKPVVLANDDGPIGSLKLLLLHIIERVEIGVHKLHVPSHTSMCPKLYALKGDDFDAGRAHKVIAKDDGAIGSLHDKGIVVDIAPSFKNNFAPHCVICIPLSGYICPP